MGRRCIATSGVEISALGLGTAALTTPYGAPGAERAAPDPSAAVRTIARALELGITFIDTAPAYGDAEAIVGQACDGAACEIATKIAIPPGGWSKHPPAAVSEHVRRSVDNSLLALRKSSIDLLQVHNADARVVAEAHLTTVLEDLRREGLIRACGATVYGEDNALAAIQCSTFDAVQIAYSALDRRAERVLVDAARDSGTALIARSILLRGVLSPAARSLRGTFAPLGMAADAFRTAVGVSWSELPAAAVAFAFTRPGITCTLLGPRDEPELLSLVSGAARYADAVRDLVGEWDRDLTEDLQDPSRWTTSA